MNEALPGVYASTLAVKFWSASNATEYTPDEFAVTSLPGLFSGELNSTLDPGYTSPDVSDNVPCTWIEGGTLTVTAWVPVTTGAVKGMTRPLPRMTWGLLRVMPLGTVTVALPLELRG